MALRIAVPSKGRLKEPALRLLAQAGFEPVYGEGDSRVLIVPTMDPEVRIVFVRPEDVPSIVGSGASELGITGLDLALESGLDVEICERLGFGRARIVLAVPREAGYKDPRDLEGLRVATKYPLLASRFFEGLGVRVKVVRVSGSAEVMPRLGAAEAIVDVLSTGTTLMLHGLEPLATIAETEAVLIARSCRGSSVIERVVESVRGVVNARRMRMVMMNVPGDSLERVLEALPSMAAPAIARLESVEPMWEVVTAVPAEELAEVVYEAKRRGARDIVVLNIERVIP